jgi:tripartite-type tricarboxylate transporter receptor subunit TctC
MVTRISEALGKIANSPEYKSKLSDMGLEIRYMNADQYNAYWTKEVARITDLMSRIK